ncbi:macrophage mannose receptor 1-like [Triplophysa rosa]|nr:macrophage mannose receptor 1-like [Triplophysa rosa]XP_057180085.1 macrophage mannose receptor 1-like [Triplophysa rosa]
MAFLSMLMLLCAFPLSNAAGRLREFHLLNKMNINEALETCKTKYTNIVTVYENEDNEELIKHVKGRDAPSALIGANTNNTNYRSKWSNGDDVIFTSFTENCTGICGAAMRSNGSWELLPHTETKYFMCYDEGVDRASHDYSLIHLNKTWTAAQLYCRRHHTDLVSITNEQENERVKNQTKDREFPFWIGLLHDNIEWADRGKSAYRNYSSKPGQGKFTILTVLTNDWQLRGSGSFAVLCYKSLIHVSEAKLSWEGAVDYCNASGLLRIESKDDQIETERELRKENISEPVWIGLRQSRLFGFWMWVNGLHVGPWTNWKGGRQPEHQISHHCGVMEKVDGTFKWTDKDCRYRFRVVCEAK